MDKDKVVIGGKYRLLNYEEAKSIGEPCPFIVPNMKPYFDSKSIVTALRFEFDFVRVIFPDGDNWCVDCRWLLPLKKEVSSKILGEDKPKIRFIRR